MSKDYYKILGVDRSASNDDVKKAFRKKAHKYHPDKKGGDEVKFKEANEAYQVLSDNEKRKQYDQFGQTFEQAQAGGGAGGGFHGFGGFEDMFRHGGQQGGVEFDFGDVFSDFFGGTRKKSHSRGTDIGTDIEIDFAEMITGVERTINLTKNSICSRCSGNGGEPGTKLNNCSTCNGSGQVESVRNTILGAIKTASVCNKCDGIGKIPEKRCNKCDGDGIVRGNEKIKVKIPHGIDNGGTIRVTGKGEAIRDGSSGNLYINVHVKPDNRFERSGYNIKTKKYVKLTQVILGDKIDIDTPISKVRLKIPDGTQSGTEFRLKGKGVPHIRGFGKGDLIVKIITRVPKKLTGKQKKLIKELEKEGI